MHAVLERTAERIERFARAQRAAIGEVERNLGDVVLRQRVFPVERAGCYAPGGRYAYPSSVLMTAVTARAAGVREVIVASPAPSPLVLAAAHVAGADAVLARLAARRELVRGVVITGGEPTLQRGLDEFCRAVQELGLRVKLDTNGSRPETLFRLLHADLVDFVAMDIKAPLDAASYRCLTGVRCDVEAVRESMALLAGSDTQYLLRTTVDRRLLSEADLATIVAALPRGARHVWQECREVEATVPPGVSGRSGRHDP